MKSILLAAFLLASSAMAQVVPTPAANYASGPISRITTPDGRTVTVTNPNITAGARPSNSLGGVTEMPPTTAFYINYSALMQPVYGVNTIRISSGSGTLKHGTEGDFRTGCKPSHMGRFDPIVYPGKEMAGHPHTFFGNSDVNGSLNDQTIGNLANFGRSTCSGGIANRSAYWIPSLIDTTKGFPLVPVLNRVYYKAQSEYRSLHPEITRPAPPGLRIIAGAPSATTEQANINTNNYFVCSGSGDPGTQFHHIPTAADLAANPVICADSLTATLSPTVNESINVGLSFYGTATVGSVLRAEIPNMDQGGIGKVAIKRADGTIAAAGTVYGNRGTLSYTLTSADMANLPFTATATDYGSKITFVVTFPQCWDGVNLDSPNHQGQMAYETTNSSTVGCPATHPIPVSSPSGYLTDYSLKSIGGRANIPNLRLSCDNYSLSLPGGYCSHGDWVNGWNPQILQTWVENCLHQLTDCGGGSIDSWRATTIRTLIDLGY